MDNEGKVYDDLNKLSQLQYGKDFIDSLLIKPTDKILSIGCGTGDLCKYVADKLSEETLLATDPDSSRIEIARHKFPDISFEDKDGATFLKGCTEKFDLIYSNVVLHWVPVKERQELFRLMFEGLKPGGIMAHTVGSCTTKDDFPFTLLGMFTDEELMSLGAPTPGTMNENLYTIDSLTSLATGQGFKVLEVKDVTTKSQFPSCDAFLKWAEATFHGKVPFSSRYAELEEKPDIGLNDNGEVTLTTFLLRGVFEKLQELTSKSCTIV